MTKLGLSYNDDSKSFESLTIPGWRYIAFVSKLSSRENLISSAGSNPVEMNYESMIEPELFISSAISTQ